MHIQVHLRFITLSEQCRVCPFLLRISRQGPSDFPAEARSDICSRCLGHAQVSISSRTFSLY